MKLFELKNWELRVSEEAWGLAPFKKLLDRDKSKSKEKALKEMLYVFFYCDIRSDYLVVPKKDRSALIINDINLPKDWAPDALVEEAMIFYTAQSKTVIEKLYESAVRAAGDIAEYLEGTRELLEERDHNGRIVNDISKITNSMEKIPKIMKNLRDAYQEVVKEKQDTESKMKGSKAFNLFEDGL